VQPSSAATSEAEALRRAVGCAYAVLRERDPGRQRLLIAADVLALLDASVVRVHAPVMDGEWRTVGDEPVVLPAPAEQMEAALLPRALAAGRSLLSTHPSLDPALAGIAEACAAARLTVHLLLVRAEQTTLAALAVHWLGRERPPFEQRIGFYNFLDTVAAALAVSQDRERRQEEVDRLRRRAYSDALTGLPNAQALEDELHRHNDTHPFSLLALDFDGMREANNALGYEAGGNVLIRLVGQTLSALAQPSEYPARMHTAGDEFVVLLPGLEATEAQHRAEDIEAALDALAVPPTHARFYHGASVGAATRDDEETPGQVLGRAVQAMRARKVSRGR
jgi:diguanylate cyclase (GGDEF)-like protein